MATNILNNQAYTGPVIVYSSEILTAQNIDISSILSTGATGQIVYTIQRRTENSGWRAAKDEADKVLEYRTIGDETNGINISGLNAFAIRVKVEILGGAGTLNIEYESL